MPQSFSSAMYPSRMESYAELQVTLPISLRIDLSNLRSTGLMKNHNVWESAMAIDIWPQE
jgi:hypothetical protein